MWSVLTLHPSAYSWKTRQLIPKVLMLRTLFLILFISVSCGKTPNFSKTHDIVLEDRGAFLYTIEDGSIKVFDCYNARVRDRAHCSYSRGEMSLSIARPIVFEPLEKELESFDLQVSELIERFLRLDQRMEQLINIDNNTVIASDARIIQLQRDMNAIEIDESDLRLKIGETKNQIAMILQQSITLQNADESLIALLKDLRDKLSKYERNISVLLESRRANRAEWRRIVSSSFSNMGFQVLANQRENLELLYTQALATRDKAMAQLLEADLFFSYLADNGIVIENNLAMNSTQFSKKLTEIFTKKLAFHRIETFAMTENVDYRIGDGQLVIHAICSSQSRCENLRLSGFKTGFHPNDPGLDYNLFLNLENESNYAFAHGSFIKESRGSGTHGLFTGNKLNLSGHNCEVRPVVATCKIFIREY
jgi:hypothetical protein